MKYICKEDFKINDFLIGRKGDVLEITDAVPDTGETVEDVTGYCVISNTVTNKKYNATWIDVDDTLELINEEH